MRNLVSGIMLIVILIGIFAVLRPALGDVPTLDVPIFELLDKQSMQVKGGVNMKFTFRNVGDPATRGTVWIPWEKVNYAASLEGSPPSGNIDEAMLGVDVNGDNDELDVFNIYYVNDTQVKVNGVVASSMWIPEQTFEINKTTLQVQEKTNFTIGSKIHSLYTAKTTYARFALDTFFRDHPSPNIEVIIYQLGTSGNIVPTAEITRFKFNGTVVPYEFNWMLHEFLIGEWSADNAYIYPLGFLDSGLVFTTEISIRGAPGSYGLNVVFNWAPDALHRYRYTLSDTVDIPFNITATPVSAQPPWFNFGKVYVNSKIDASCKLLNGEIISLKSRPQWLEVTHIESDWLSFSINTSMEGCYSDSLIIETTVGEISVEVNIIVRSAPMPSLKMLIFNTPFEMYSTDHPEIWKTFTDIMDIGLVNVSYVGYHRGYYGAFPSDVESYDITLVDGGGLCSLVSNEIDYLKNYIKNGGNLIICADAFMIGSVEQANRIANDFGLSIRDEEYGYEIFITDFTPHPITKGVARLRVLRPSPVEALTVRAVALAHPPSVSENEGILAISEQSGKMIVLGNSLWWYSFLYYGWSYDNPQLFLNIFEYIRRAPPTFPWRDDFNYNTLNEMKSAGWTLSNEFLISVVGGAVPLDNDGSVGSEVTYMNFPSGIYDWRAETSGMWIGRSYGSIHLSIVTERHHYRWGGDGYYPEFVLYRDESKVLRFAGYTPQLNTWAKFAIEKRGNTIYLYYNDELKNTYIEPDDTPSALISTILWSGWIATVKYDYISVTSPIILPSFKISNIFSPMQVKPNQEFYVSVAISYTFTSDTKVSVEIWNYTGNERLAYINDVLSGCDFKIYDFELKSPPSTGMLELLVNASYLEEDTWKQEKVGSEYLLRIPVVQGEMTYSVFYVTNSFFNISYNGKWYKTFMIENMTWQNPPDPNDVEAFYKWRFSQSNWLVLNSSGNLVDNADDYAKIAFAAQAALWGICEYENLLDRGGLFKELFGYAIAAETCRTIGSIASGMVGGIVLGYITPSFTVNFFAQSLVSGIEEGITDPGELVTRMAIGGLESGSSELYTAANIVKPVYEEYMTKYYPYTILGVHADYADMIQYFIHKKTGYVVGYSSMRTLSKIYGEGVGSYLKSIARSLVESSLTGAEAVAYAEKLISETPELKGFLEDIAKEENYYNVINSTFFESTKQIATILTNSKSQIAILSKKTNTGKVVNLLISTNSTILSNFMSEANKCISLKVEGESGTEGTLQISIPKTLLSESASEINKILVTIDGKEAPFIISETREAYILTVNYAHSKHAILIYYVTYPLTAKVTSIINQPLANAKVALYGSDNLELSEYTDSNGYTVFDKVPSGNFAIKTEYKGLSETQMVFFNETKQISISIDALDVFGTPLRTSHAILLTIITIALITIVFTIAIKKRKAKKIT
jgi:archaellin